MNKLNFPEFNFNIRKAELKTEIFDKIRKKWVVLTPEEWVRQHTIWYLTDFLNYPEYMISVEKEFFLFKTSQKADIVVFNKQAKPILLVECKAPTVKIDPNTLNQAVRYCIELKSKIILLTNGTKHIVVKVDGNKSTFLNNIPNFDDLQKQID